LPCISQDLETVGNFPETYFRTLNASLPFTGIHPSTTRGPQGPAASPAVRPGTAW